MNYILSIFAINIFAYMTIRLRPKIFGVELFKPMIWNFKLSILPNIVLLISILLYFLINIISAYTGYQFIFVIGLIVLVLGFFAWILLLPNSGYLITELNLTHRSQDKVEVPIWYDIISILSFAMSGIVNTVFGINFLQFIVLIILDPPKTSSSIKWILMISNVIISILVSIGIYFGRNIRFNSWDIKNPKKFFAKLKGHFSKENIFKEFSLFVLLYTIFFIIMANLFDLISMFMLFGK